MRILHTSDWHIGRTFHGHSTLDALRGVLDVLVAQVREQEVDVVLVAGDVFDSATPAAAAYRLLSDTLAALADTGAQVVVTSGNHDSAARLGFQSALLREGVRVATDPATIGTPVTLRDADGDVHIYPLPYLEPALLRHRWEGVRTQEQAMSRAMELVHADRVSRGGRSVVVAHCFAAGVEPTHGLERDIQQGGLDVVPLSLFDGIDYVALGHIHGRQRLADHVRYAGAPLHYSFGEATKPRGSWLIDLAADGSNVARWLELPVPRSLVTLRGAFEEILADPAYAGHDADWVAIEYTDSVPVRDPMRRAQERFPFCAHVAHLPAVTRSRADTSYVARVRAARSDRDLLDVFLRHVREGEGATTAEADVLAEVLDDRIRVEASL